MVARNLLLLLLFTASCLSVQCRKIGSLRGKGQAHRTLYGERIKLRATQRGGYGGSFRQQAGEIIPMRKKIRVVAPTTIPTDVPVTSAPSVETTMEYSNTGAPTMEDTAIDTLSPTEAVSISTALSSSIIDAPTATEPLTSSPSFAPVLSVNTANQASYGYVVTTKDPSLVATVAPSSAPSMSPTGLPMPSSPPSSTAVEEETTEDSRGLYVGCWMDDSLATEWDAGVDYSISSCMAYCHNFEFSYAGMQYPHRCFCGTGYDENGEAPEGECSLLCRQGGGMCGNLGRISVWKIPGGV